MEERKKNLNLSRKVVKAKNDYGILSEDVAYARVLLLKAIGKKEGLNDDMPLAELVEMYDTLASQQMAPKEEAEDEDGPREPTSEEEKQKLEEVERCIQDVQVRRRYS